MNYKQLNKVSIREGFNNFNRRNPHIYKAFEQECFKAIANGKKKISAKLIINWIRWNEFLQSSDKNFKINDAYQAYYARHFVELNPQHADLFDFRKLRNEEEGPYMEVDSENNIYFL